MSFYVELHLNDDEWCRVEGPYSSPGLAHSALLVRAAAQKLPPTEYRVQQQRDTVPGPEQGIPAKDVAAMGDMKAALRSGVKPDLTHVRTPLLNYIARACEYGNDKYERSNYLRATKGNKEDFERLRAYLRAAVSHTLQTLDAMEAHQATDPKLEDVEGMKKAAFAVDTDPDKTGKVGPSMLPHLCGAAASFMMAITQATNAGLLPADPGTPWRK